jgi:hypothetical protein
MTALVIAKDDARDARDITGAKKSTSLTCLQSDLITNAGSASMLAQPALDNLETQIHHTARQLSAAQVNLLRVIQDACADGGSWTSADPRFELVGGLGRSLHALASRGLIVTDDDDNMILTPLGRLVVDAAPDLADLLLADERYTQIMRNAAELYNASDDDWYEAWALVVDVKTQGTGHGLLIQMCTFDMLEHDDGGVIWCGGSKRTTRYRLSAAGRRFVTDALGITLKSPYSGPVWPAADSILWLAGEDTDGDLPADEPAYDAPQLTAIQVEALSFEIADVTYFDLEVLDNLVELGLMRCYHCDSPWMAHDSYHITAAGFAALEAVA